MCPRVFVAQDHRLTHERQGSKGDVDRGQESEAGRRSTLQRIRAVGEGRPGVEEDVYIFLEADHAHTRRDPGFDPHALIETFAVDQRQVTAAQPPHQSRLDLVV